MDVGTSLNPAIDIGQVNTVSFLRVFFISDKQIPLCSEHIGRFPFGRPVSSVMGWVNLEVIVVQNSFTLEPSENDTPYSEEI